MVWRQAGSQSIGQDPSIISRIALAPRPRTSHSPPPVARPGGGGGGGRGRQEDERVTGQTPAGPAEPAGPWAVDGAMR
jgi:hypothetical protein